MLSSGDFLKEVIANIDRIREKNGMNAKEFALKIGKRPGILTDWRTGRSSPSLDTIFHICELFDCTFYDIFPRTSFSSARSNDNNDTFSERTLLKFYNGMSASDREELLLIAEIKYNKGKENIEKLSPSGGNEKLA